MNHKLIKQISTYKEIIEQVTANKNYGLNQILKQKENVEECNKSIKRYKKKIKQLEQEELLKWQ